MWRGVNFGSRNSMLAAIRMRFIPLIPAFAPSRHRSMEPRAEYAIRKTSALRPSGLGHRSQKSSGNNFLVRSNPTLPPYLFDVVCQIMTITI
jgi:hypothetical protein